MNAHEPSTLRLSTYNNADYPLWVLMASILPGWVTTTGELLGPIGTMHKEFFPRIQRQLILEPATF